MLEVECIEKSHEPGYFIFKFPKLSFFNDFETRLKFHTHTARLSFLGVDGCLELPIIEEFALKSLHSWVDIPTFIKSAFTQRLCEYKKLIIEQVHSLITKQKPSLEPIFIHGYLNHIQSYIDCLREKSIAEIELIIDDEIWK